MTLDEIVSDYIRVYRDEAARETRSFKILRGLSATIRQAALCKLPGGKRHSHQRRISQSVLAEAERRLQLIAAELEEAPNFTALHHLVEREIRPIRRVADLTVYDIAHRIGAFLGKAPELVYLHRGTKQGAAILGFRGKAIDPKMLPSPFFRLTAAEIEDCLYIYKDRLNGRDLRSRVMRTTSSCFTEESSTRQKC